MTDPITDMLNRIRNGQAVMKETVSVPFSNTKFAVAEILKANGYISEVEKKGRKEKRTLEITIKYEAVENSPNAKKPTVLGLKRISKPGKRVYRGYKEIRPVRNGYGIAIFSTPNGLLTDKEARKQKVGGEVICEIW